uniref:Transcription initiation factor IIF subunit alpha n=1 Tax=Clastoptera arizonana TaxID=38151 RepID=A0A1B6DU65_9HEMI
MTSNKRPSTSSSSLEEFSIRVLKNDSKKHHIMRFNSAQIDFTKWSQVKMERENNQREFAKHDEDQPKFGAGSEFGREAKEEARLKKLGIMRRKYNPEDQPWILKSGGKIGQKFKGIREGGIGENAAYYVFTHAGEKEIEAFPLHEWYNFQAINRYKSLSAEEAEEEFGRRNKLVNYFSLMMRKRLRNEDGDLEEGEETNTKKVTKKTKKDLKISDMDDWIDSDEDVSSSEGGDKSDDENKEKKKTKKKGANNAKKKEKKKGSDDSAVEESDDGDEEGRELDYISDSSDSDSDHEAKVDKEMKGVAEESALRRLLNSDEEDEDEEEKEENKKSDPEEPNPPEETPPSSATKKKKKSLKKEKDVKTEKGTSDKHDKNNDSSSDFTSDSSDSEETKTKLQSNSTNTAGEKRSLTAIDGPAVKKPRLETSPLLISGSDNGITEDAVRRYLMRKPMTATELLQKFKCKKTGLSSEQLVNVMTQILKKINPVKQTIQNKMYLSIKTEKHPSN